MLPLRILQVSDLHTGTHEEPEVETGLRDVVVRLEPELVIASGDLTHRNRREQHERAASFLRSLGPPVLAVPGNHDIPALPPMRLTRTLGEFERVWGESEPVFRSDRLVAVALDSVRPWKYQRGAIRPAQLERAASELSTAPPGALRVVVLHHHLTDAPWRNTKRTIPSRSRVLAALAEARAELVVSGHTHQSSVHEHREIQAGVDRPLVLAVAPGLRRPRARRPSEVGGFHLYEATDDVLAVLTYAWHGEGFEIAAERRYPRASA
jgi:3',5'-cyclic AMP phosphodiesterase CpdA